MLVVILIYDVLVFRPLVAWADRFRFEQQARAEPLRSWALTMLQRSRIATFVAATTSRVLRRTSRPRQRMLGGQPERPPGRWIEALWYLFIAGLVAGALWEIVAFVSGTVPLAEVGRVCVLGLLTMLRVFVLIAAASAFWVPIGIWIGLRPGVARIAQPIAQFLAAFPANLLFPQFVSAIIAFRLDPDIWLSPLMVLGTQWYILFNVIAGAAAVPNELHDVATNLRLRGALWWRRLSVPAVMPFYVTGAITASGGSWNASIVAEVATCGSTRLEATGLGSYIANATSAGDFHRIVLGIAVMSAYVTLINRAFWRPLYWYAERSFRLS